MCRSMVDIQSTTAENRRGIKKIERTKKKEEERINTKEETTAQNKMSASATQGGHNQTRTRLWANAQRDGRPVEYRCRPLYNAAKFG